MVTQNTLEHLDFATREDYFDYILESKANGQRTQARELFKKLSANQKKQFFNYVDTAYYYEAHDNNVVGLSAELVNYLM